MTKDNLYIFDTTLRDGNQTPGVDFTLDDKNRISNILDELGVDYIEGGYPGANPIDTDFFNAPPNLKKSKFVSFGISLNNFIFYPCKKTLLISFFFEYKKTIYFVMTIAVNIEVAIPIIKVTENPLIGPLPNENKAKAANKVVKLASTKVEIAL